VVSHEYFRIGALEPSACEQYPQFSGHSPDLRLTR
jgi:hypothetical protein